MRCLPPDLLRQQPFQMRVRLHRPLELDIHRLRRDRQLLRDRNVRVALVAPLKGSRTCAAAGPKTAHGLCQHREQQHGIVCLSSDLRPLSSALRPPSSLSRPDSRLLHQGEGVGGRGPGGWGRKKTLCVSRRSPLSDFPHLLNDAVTPSSGHLLTRHAPTHAISDTVTPSCRPYSPRYYPYLYYVLLFLLADIENKASRCHKVRQQGSKRVPCQITGSPSQKKLNRTRLPVARFLTA